MKRRAFVRMAAGAAGAGLAVIERLLADFRSDGAIASRVAGLPRRVLGRTGREISIVGFPGLALSHETQESSNAAVRQAFDRGVNYFDVAPAYGKNGECEIKLGEALRQLDRSRIFLSCKTKVRDREGSRAELERSLQRLHTDHFDLYQLHHLVTPDDVRRAFGPSGAMESLLAAKKDGKVRWLGFPAHSTKAALAALEAHPFDTVMFPISFAEYYLRDFGRDVLDAAERRGAAVLAIKPMCMGAWPKDAQRARRWWYRTTETQEEVSLAMRFSLSLKGVVAGIPPSFVELLDRAITAGAAYEPATTADRDRLRELAKSCITLFLREDQLGNGIARHQEIPYPERPSDCV